MGEHTDFVAAFRGGRFRSTRGEEIAVRAEALGTLEIRSRKVTACDPLSAFELVPFSREVPTGRFAVSAAVATYRGEDRRVAAAMLHFGDDEPVRWEMATRDGENVAELAEGMMFGYGVDAGTGCFADADMAAHLPDPDVQQRLQDELQSTYEDTWSRAAIAGIVAFSSGFGDGFYSSYWGFDAKGRLVALATDFGLLLDPVEVRVLLAPEGPFDDDALAKAGVKVRARKPSSRKGPSVEVTSTRSLEIDPVGADGERARVGYEMSSQGPTRVYSFDPLAAGTKLRVSVLLGLKPMTKLPA